MKVCKYCGILNDDSAATCSGCGSPEFSNKCANCGAVFDSGFCPSCGTKAGAKAFACPHCGTRYFSAACPNCGYSAAREAAEQKTNTVYTIRTEPEEQKKAGTFGKVLLWIFFFPIMAVVAIWKSKMHIVWKILLTLLILAFFVYYGTSS